MRKGLLKVHFTIIGILYGVLAIAASIEQTIFIKNGIGILQNPPFFVHLLCGACSIPLVLMLVSRIVRLPETDEESSVILEFLSSLKRNKLKAALFNLAFLAGLFALAYNIVLSSSYRVNIYDSIIHPLTFSAYSIVRAYLYLACYPFVFSATPTITYYLFRTVKKAPIQYRPFHYDEMGGLRKYFVAVDRPVYVVQSFAVLIALMNYLGWGGMLLVPMILTIAAPTIVTLLAIFLFAHFHAVLTSKKREEVQAIRMQQMELYCSARSLATLSSKDCLDLLERIEATERLVESVKKRNRNDLGKYFVNMTVLLATQILKPAGELIAQKFLGGGP